MPRAARRKRIHLPEVRMIPDQPTSRRAMLSRTALGFGSLALNAMLSDRTTKAESAEVNNPRQLEPQTPLAPRSPNFTARAKSVVFLFMQGGVSHVDTFDPKPALDKYHGQAPPFKRTRIKFATRGNLLKSPCGNICPRSLTTCAWFTQSVTRTSLTAAQR